MLQTRGGCQKDGGLAGPCATARGRVRSDCGGIWGAGTRGCPRFAVRSLRGYRRLSWGAAGVIDVLAPACLYGECSRRGGGDQGSHAPVHWRSPPGAAAPLLPPVGYPGSAAASADAAPGGTSGSYGVASATPSCWRWVLSAVRAHFTGGGLCGDVSSLFAGRCG